MSKLSRTSTLKVCTQLSLLSIPHLHRRHWTCSQARWTSSRTSKNNSLRTFSVSVNQRAAIPCNSSMQETSTSSVCTILQTTSGTKWSTLSSATKGFLRALQPSFLTKTWPRSRDMSSTQRQACSTRCSSLNSIEYDHSKIKNSPYTT